MLAIICIFAAIVKSSDLVKLVNQSGFYEITGDSNENDCITQIRPFICADGKDPECNKPYLEFSNIVEFMAEIPDSKELIQYLKKNDLKSLVKMASRCNDIRDYDAYSAFFYNADSYIGAINNVFDTNYILFFLRRFYYFIDLTFIDRSATVSSSNLVNKSTGRMVDILCIPDYFNNLVFGSETDSTNIFNIILADTVIGDYVINFINVIIYQIQLSTRDSVKLNEKHNTFGLYLDVLKAYLIKTKFILQKNFSVKYEFLQHETNFVFAYIPLSNTHPSDHATEVGIVNVSPPIYTDNYLLARFIK